LYDPIKRINATDVSVFFYIHFIRHIIYYILLIHNAQTDTLLNLFIGFETPVFLKPPCSSPWLSVTASWPEKRTWKSNRNE